VNRQRGQTHKSVIMRDLVVFLIKLGIDNLKGLAVIQLAILAAAIDIVAPGERPGHRFYGLLRLSERFDLWLNLYGPASGAEDDEDGLFGRSRAGSNSLLGKLEGIVRGDDFDDPAAAKQPSAGATV
jgi:hypothetical protein